MQFGVFTAAFITPKYHHLDAVLRAHAYKLWQEQPHHDALWHWLQAEAIIRSRVQWYAYQDWLHIPTANPLHHWLQAERDVVRQYVD